MGIVNINVNEQHIPLITQETGQSTTTALSQKASTDELNKLYSGTVIDMKSLPFPGWVRESDQGIQVDTGGWVHSDFIECKEHSTVIGVFVGFPTVSSIGFFNAQKELISTICSPDDGKFYVNTTTPENTKYIRLCTSAHPSISYNSYCILPSVVPNLLGSCDKTNNILGENFKRGYDSETATRDLNIMLNGNSRWIQNILHNYVILDISQLVTGAGNLFILDLSIENYEQKTLSKIQFTVFIVPSSNWYNINYHTVQDNDVIDV